MTTQDFWKRVVKTDGCWLWTGYISRQVGYGFFYLEGDYMTASRAMWIITNGQITEPDLQVCHTCDNRQCVRPDHLFLGTRVDNMQDALRKGRLDRGLRIARMTVPSGSKHWTRRHPNWILRGSARREAKLNESNVRAMRSQYAKGDVSIRSLAEAYGVGFGAAYRAVKRIGWKHVK